MARREHSRAELERKLARHAQAIDEVRAVLDDLERRGYLSEDRFVEQFVNEKARRYGAARIGADLRARGVSVARVREAIAASRESEPERVMQVWRKKFGQLPTTSEARAKQMRFLASRGFSESVVRRLFRLLDTSER